jgi:hypothetical protein
VVDDSHGEYDFLYAIGLCHGLCRMRTEEEPPKHNA